MSSGNTGTKRLGRDLSDGAGEDLEAAMPDSADLIRKADELKQQAEHEPDRKIRQRLTRMADRYVHLAESQAWSREHPPSAADLADLFVRRD